MTLLEYDAFLSELTRMFLRSRASGSLRLTMKRYDGRTKPVPKISKNRPPPPKVPPPALPAHPPSEYQCLIRAKLGNKGISTVVFAKDVNKFQMAYISVLKGNIDSLKKRDKKAKGTTSKTKATQ